MFLAIYIYPYIYSIIIIIIAEPQQLLISLTQSLTLDLRPEDV